MGRYLVFGGDVYYSLGGFNDLLCSFDFESDAIDRAKSYVSEDEDNDRWSHVVDSTTGLIIKGF